jgi:hypothetical protein
LDEINIGPKRDFRWPSRRWLAAAAATALIAATAALIVTSGGDHHAPLRPGPSTVATGPTPSPTAAPGTLLRTCESANWGKLPTNWRVTSLRAGPLWFVVHDRRAGYVHYGSSQRVRPTVARNGRLNDGVMIVEVTDGSTVVMKPAAGARPYFRFVDGFNGPAGNELPDGDTGFTLSACPRGDKGPNGQVTDFYLGFLIQHGRTAPVEVRPSASSSPIWVIFGRASRKSAG